MRVKGQLRETTDGDRVVETVQIVLQEFRQGRIATSIVRKICCDTSRYCGFDPRSRADDDWRGENFSHAGPIGEGYSERD